MKKEQSAQKLSSWSKGAKSLLALPALAAVFLLSGCGANTSTSAPSNSYSTAPTNATQTAQPSTTTPVSGAMTVNIQNFAFSPQTLTIKKGTTVTWTNNDSMTHTLKSDTFNSSPLSKGQTFSFKFDQAGTFDYICSIHPSMTGKIIVE